MGKQVLKINSTFIQDPQTMEWSIQDLDADGTGRNQLGDMFRDRVAVKRKLVCRWGALEAAEMSTLLNAMTDEFFTLEYPDALTGARRSGTFYVGDRTAPCYYYNSAKGKWLWEGLSANFVER